MNDVLIKRKSGMSRRGRVVLTSCATIVAGLIAMGTAPVVAEENAQVPGGSNYNWFDLDECDREPFGVLKNFHTVEDTVREQLSEMYASGQQRLRIGIYHGRGLDSGTLLDSTGGDLTPQSRENLANLLAAAKDTGFAEVEVAMHAQGENDPNGWESFSDDLYQENWQLIQNLRPIVAESGLHYRLDLGNELIPAPNQPMTLQYAQRLWADYTAAYGKDDTVGFSIIGMEPARIAQIPAVYGENEPYLFDLHFYGNDQGDEYQQFVNARNQMSEMGLNQGWIVGETYYNDAAAAEGIRRAITDTGQQVFWLAQWPLTRDRNCEHVDVAAPTAFDNFVAHGFGQVPDATVEPLKVDRPVASDTLDGPRPEFAGTGQPGSAVTVTVDGGQVGQAAVADDGSWSLVSDADLPVGVRFDAVVTQVAGDDEQQAVVAGLGVKAPAVTITSPDDGAKVTAAVSIEGNSSEDAVLTVDEDWIGELTVADNGDWSFVPENTLADGEYTFALSATLDGADPDLADSEASVEFTVTEPGGDEGDGDVGTDEGSDDGADRGIDGGADDGADSGTDGGAEGDDQLPDTGTSGIVLAALALGLIGLGGVTLASRRMVPMA